MTQPPMSNDQHEDDLVTRVAQAIWDVADEDYLETKDLEHCGVMARAAIEASGITDLTRQLADANMLLGEAKDYIPAHFSSGLALLKRIDAVLNPEQPK